MKIVESMFRVIWKRNDVTSWEGKVIVHTPCMDDLPFWQKTRLDCNVYQRRAVMVAESPDVPCEVWMDMMSELNCAQREEMVCFAEKLGTNALTTSDKLRLLQITFSWIVRSQSEHLNMTFRASARHVQDAILKAGVHLPHVLVSLPAK